MRSIPRFTGVIGRGSLTFQRQKNPSDPVNRVKSFIIHPKTAFSALRLTDSFQELNNGRRFDLAIMAVGAYDPWIRSPARPEQVVAMCDRAGVEYIVPVRRQTFQLRFEPLREPIERFEAALRNDPRRIALREIGETFVLP